MRTYELSAGEDGYMRVVYALLIETELEGRLRRLDLP